MRWTVDGASAIIALPYLEASSQREAIRDTPHSDTDRLTSLSSKMILTTYKIDVHPFVYGFRHFVGPVGYIPGHLLCGHGEGTRWNPPLVRAGPTMTCPSPGSLR